MTILSLLAVLAPAQHRNDRETAEIIGSETLVRGSVGGNEVTVRLPGMVREIPTTRAASLEQLHLFAASGDRVAV